MEKRLTMILASLFLFVGMALAQTRVTGVVTSSEDGLPVIGASVKVVGTNTGTATNADGEFTLTVQPGTKLRITYLGMQPKTVEAKPGMKVVLDPDAHSIDEVVVTGYGSARKLGTIAGSVETVSGKTLENRPVANLGDAMQGQVAGLQVFTSSGEPSAGVSMRIRGVSSVYASTTPLFILDGSEISQSTFLALNPNDIESMTVLKDASSTAIYGSRAANGVVILTSKRAKFGEAPTITVAAQYGISNMAYDNVDMMNSDQWFQLQQMITPSLANNAAFQAKRNYFNKYGISTNWKDVFFDGNAPTSQVDVSVRGGSMNTSYLLSFQHFTNSGLLDDSYLRRESMRANIESNITPWMKIGSNTNLAYLKTSTTAFTSTGASIYNKTSASHTLLPIQTPNAILGLVTDARGNIDYANSTFEGYGQENIYYDEAGQYNPFFISRIQPTVERNMRINENAFVNLNPVKGLNIRSAVGLEAVIDRYSYKAYNTLDIDPDVFKTGIRQEESSVSYRWTVTNTAEYKFDFLRDHHVSVLAGQESMLYKYEDFSARGEGLTDNRLMLLSAAPSGKITASQSVSKQVRNSWFGMLNYSYADKYFVDLSLRRDGSSLFAPDNRWATFGAGALMWNVSSEKFMAPTRSWLNNLQLKASYGSTGNSGISPYMYLGLVAAGGSYNGNASTSIANAPNPKLTWETVKTLNLALSGRLFNRVDFDVEYYDKTTSNMLMTVPYSFTTGFSSGWGNVSEMYNRGVDITVGVDIIKNKDWYWNVKANANYNKNEITKLYEGADFYDIANTGLRLEVGHPYGELYYVRWSHVDPRDGQNVWLDKNGNETKVYDEANKVFLGKSTVAPWSAGLSSTLSWKGLQLDVQFTGMFDRYMLNNERWFNENPSFASQNNQRVEMLNMWTTPGQVTDIAAADAERQMDSHLIENASFVRLKFLQLSYTLPKNIMNATRIMKGARVFFIARNLLTFSGYKGYDPEVDSNISIGNYPNTRQFSLGAELTF